MSVRSLVLFLVIATGCAACGGNDEGSCVNPAAPGCNSPQPQPQPQPQPVTPGPISLTFTCNGTPGGCTIELGAAAEIAWTSTNATSCTVGAFGWTGLNNIQNTGRLFSSRDYSLRCTNSAGEQTATVKVSVSPMIGGPGVPYVELAPFPPMGSTFGIATGRLIHGIPADHRLMFYILVNGWWVKPTFANMLTFFAADASFSVNLFTGGMDSTTREIVVFLVTKDHVPVKAGGDRSIPIRVNGRDVLAQYRITR